MQAQSSESTGPTSPTSGTSRLSTPQRSRQLTLFAADTPASPFPWPGGERARAMTATSGQQCARSLRLSVPLGCCVRTLLVTSRWASTVCFLTWRRKDTPASRLLFQLVPSTPRTDAIESGLWRTPEFPGNRRQIISDQVDGEEALRPTGGIGRPSVGGRKETLAHHDGALLPREEHEVCSGRHSADVCGEVLADSQGQSERTRLREDEQRGQRRGRPGDSSAQALPNTAGLGRGKGGSEPTGLIRESISLCDSIHVPDAHREQEGRATIPRGECCQWLLEPGVGRVAYGVPRRVDRLRCLGNAVVPQVAYEIGRAIMTAHHGVTA